MSSATSYLPETNSYSPVQEFDAAPFRIRPIVALRALSKLLKDKEDTEQVFHIMRALSGRSIPNGYRKMLESPQGGAIAFRREELAQILSDTAFLRTLPEGSVGRAYLEFVSRENISAQGLVEESRKSFDQDIDRPHPFSWYGRRLRDIHDLWHILSGYGRDALGETCLVAFSYAQTKSHGFGFIAAAGALKLTSEIKGYNFIKAVWQAYRNGRKAQWLPGEDYIKLLSEPLTSARRRLNISEPSAYLAIPASVRNGNGEMLAASA